MAVYSTMIRDDPDSRARLRVTPEQTPQLPQLLLPRLLDRPRHPRTRLHRRNLPPARHRRRVGRAPPRRTSRARRPLPRAARLHPRHPPTRTKSPSNGGEPARSASPDGSARVPRRALRGEGHGQTTRSALGRRARRAGTSRPAPTPQPFDRWRRPRPHTARAATHPDEDQRDAAPANDHARRRQRRGHRPADERAARPRSPDTRCRSTTRPRPSRPTSPTAPCAASSDARSSAPPPKRARRAGARQPARARVPGPHQRDRRRRPARRRRQAAPPLRRGLRHPRAARPRRTRADAR